MQPQERAKQVRSPKPEVSWVTLKANSSFVVLAQEAGGEGRRGSSLFAKGEEEAAQRPKAAAMCCAQPAVRLTQAAPEQPHSS